MDVTYRNDAHCYKLDLSNLRFWVQWNQPPSNTNGQLNYLWLYTPTLPQRICESKINSFSSDRRLELVIFF